MYVPQTLWSAVQLGTAVTFVVVDNARYAILESAAQFAGLEGLPSMELPGLDFVALAQSFGCRAVRVTDPRDLGPALADAVAGAEPVLLDVIVDPALIPLLRSEPSPT
jgi:benzoylformate decarboxylase